MVIWQKNPVGEVPLLEWRDASTNEIRSIPESLIVCDYLEATHPEVRLYPEDPFVKAKQQVLVSRFSSVSFSPFRFFFLIKQNFLQVFSPFYGLMHGGDKNAVAELQNALQNYEKELHETFFCWFKTGNDRLYDLAVV